MRRLGEVVYMRNGIKPLMICGRDQIDIMSGNRFDYMGYLFPEGHIGAGFSFLFNEDDIEPKKTKELTPEETEKMDEEFVQRYLSEPAGKE